MTEVYPRAPITEAVIELRTDPIDPETAKRIKRRIESRYERSEELVMLEMEASVDPRTEAKVTRTPRGYKRTSADEADIGQGGTTGGISVSRLAPYQGWEQLIPRLQKDWADLRKVIGRPRLQRIGVRFINRI